MSVLLGGCADEPPPRQEVIRPFKAIKITDYEGFLDRSFPGQPEATQEVDLSFDVAGTVVERPVLTRNTANFEGAKELIKKDFISQFDYDKLEASVEVSDSSLLVERKALSDTVLKAPFDGVITNLYVENYQSVQPKQAVAERKASPFFLGFVPWLPARTHHWHF